MFFFLFIANVWLGWAVENALSIPPYCFRLSAHAHLRAFTRNKTEFPFLPRKFSIFMRYFFGKSSFSRDFPNYGIILLYHTVTRAVKRFLENFTGFLALSLFMALALGADNHNSTVSFNYFALIAHMLYRRSDFHCIFSLLIKTFRRFYDLLRHVIRPFVKSYGLISNFTVSPSMIRI